MLICREQAKFLLIFLAFLKDCVVALSIRLCTHADLIALLTTQPGCILIRYISLVSTNAYTQEEDIRVHFQG